MSTINRFEVERDYFISERNKWREEAESAKLELLVLRADHTACLIELNKLKSQKEDAATDLQEIKPLCDIRDRSVRIGDVWTFNGKKFHKVYQFSKGWAHDKAGYGFMKLLSGTREVAHSQWRLVSRVGEGKSV